jgi:hypothetical protein
MAKSTKTTLSKSKKRIAVVAALLSLAGTLGSLAGQPIANATDPADFVHCVTSGGDYVLCCVRYNGDPLPPSSPGDSYGCLFDGPGVAQLPSGGSAPQSPPKPQVNKPPIVSDPGRATR